MCCKVFSDVLIVLHLHHLTSLVQTTIPSYALTNSDQLVHQTPKVGAAEVEVMERRLCCLELFGTWPLYLDCRCCWCCWGQEKEKKEKKEKKAKEKEKKEKDKKKEKGKEKEKEKKVTGCI